MVPEVCLTLSSRAFGSHMMLAFSLAGENERLNNSLALMTESDVLAVCNNTFSPTFAPMEDGSCG